MTKTDTKQLKENTIQSRIEIARKLTDVTSDILAGSWDEAAFVRLIQIQRDIIRKLLSMRNSQVVVDDIDALANAYRDHGQMTAKELIAQRLAKV